MGGPRRLTFRQRRSPPPPDPDEEKRGGGPPYPGPHTPPARKSEKPRGGSVERGVSAETMKLGSAQTRR